MSLSMLNNVKPTSLSSDIDVLNPFLINFSVENDRSLLQFATIRKRNILSEISTFGKVSLSLLFASN